MNLFVPLKKDQRDDAATFKRITFMMRGDGKRETERIVVRKSERGKEISRDKGT